MKMNKTYVLLVFMVLIASCRMNSDNQSNESEEAPLRIGINTWPGYGAFFIAREKGFFESENVDVKFLLIEGDVERETALISKKIDGIGMTMDNLVLLRNKGLDAKAIFKYDNSFGADGIVSDASITTPNDLRGKKVAWAPGTPSHFFLLKYLENSGVRTSELVHVNLASEAAGAAFATGDLDAAVTWEPWLSKAQENESSRILSSTASLPVIEDVLFFHSQVIENRQNDLQKFLIACFKAIDYWEDHPHEGNEIIATSLELPLEDVTAMLEGIKIMNYEDNLNFFSNKAGKSIAQTAYDNAYETWRQEGVLGKDESTAEISGIHPDLILDLVPIESE